MIHYRIQEIWKIDSSPLFFFFLKERHNYLALFYGGRYPPFWFIFGIPRSRPVRMIWWRWLRMNHSEWLEIFILDFRSISSDCHTIDHRSNKYLRWPQYGLEVSVTFYKGGEWHKNAFPLCFDRFMMQPDCSWRLFMVFPCLPDVGLNGEYAPIPYTIG